MGYELGNYYGSAINFPYAIGQRLATTSSDFAFGTGDFTVEVWIYPNQVVNYKTIFATRPDNGPHTDGFNVWIDVNGATGVYSNAFLTRTANGAIVPNQWTHVVAERYNGQLTTYVNGVAAAVQASNTQNYTRTVASIGELAVSNQEQFDGVMQDLRVYKGVAKYKGGFDVPKPYTPVGIDAFRITADTCKNNFATLNPLNPTSGTLSNGNLSFNRNGKGGSTSTFGVDSGKFYVEAIGRVTGNGFGFGFVQGDYDASGSGSDIGASATAFGVRFKDTNTEFKPLGGSSTTYSGQTNTDSTVIAFAVDFDTGAVTFYRNGISIHTVTLSLPAGKFFAAIASETSTQEKNIHINFGQNPSFAGTRTAGTNTDSNGKGLFKYAPPSGFLALCEDNLPAPVIADPGEHFKTVLWTGDGAARSITGIGFTPDLVWIKRRSQTADHRIFDSVRGPAKILYSNSTAQENSDTSSLTSFDDDGFSAISDYGTNGNGGNFVAWCWKAGGAAVSNTDGTITSQVSANQTAGFSIVSYTGNGTVGATVGHGLGKKPKFFITKNRDSANAWPVFSEELLGSNGYIYLNSTNNAATTSGISAPTSSVLTLSGYNDNNKSGDEFIAYCWAEIEGFSKFGSWNGNANVDGPFVYCGFKPAFILTKRTDSATNGNWTLFDSSRSSTNPVGKHLRADTSDTELNFGTGIDILSNGFKIREAANALNNGSGTYIFMAFAESPFQTANAK